MEKNKKILLVVPRLNIGGAETYVLTLALLLHRRGFCVHVASGGGELVKTLNENNIVHHFVPIRLNADLAARMLARLIKVHQIDLIHANSAAAGIAAVKLKQRTKVPVVYTAHGIFGHNEKEMTLAQCDKIICVSAFVHDFAQAKGFPAEKLHTVYTGIDLGKFCPDETTREKIRLRLNIPDEAFTLAISARMKNLHNKGHIDLLRILKEFPGAQKWHLVVIGTGKAFWCLRYLIWRWHLNDRVHCVGQQTDVAAFLNAADAVVLPSKFETFGLALAEGMAMGKAAVAYAVGGTPEVIQDGETGYLAQVNDVGDLYDKIVALAAHPKLCLEKGKKARAYVASCFSCDKMTDDVAAIYEEAINKNRGLLK